MESLLITTPGPKSSQGSTDNVLPGSLLNQRILQNLKEEMDQLKDEPDRVDKIREAMSPEALGLITADYVFGDKLDSKDEDLFLACELDETDDVQSKLVAMIDSIYDQNGMVSPDHHALHVYHRGAKMSLKGVKDLGYKFCSIMVLSGFQCFQMEPNYQHVLQAGKMTRLFDMEKFVPYVPKLTRINLGKGKSTIKNRTYRSIVVWSFWTSYPIHTKIDTTKLNATMKALNDEIEAAGLTKEVQEINDALDKEFQEGNTSTLTGMSQLLGLEM